MKLISMRFEALKMFITRVMPCVAAVLMMSTAAIAQSTIYPSKIITIIVPQAPGGGTDIVTRTIAQEVGRLFNQAIVIENRSGAGGNIGSAFVARSKADGYTLLVNTVNHVINPALYKKNAGYDAQADFVPVAELATGNLILAVNSKSPYESLRSLLDAARKGANPVMYSSPGNGSINHLAIALLEKQAGVKFVHIPYGGAAAASNALIAGEVDFSILAPASSAGFITSGKLRALGTTSGKLSSMPAVPMISEVVPGYEVSPWYGIFAPKGTPNEIISVLNSTFNQAQSGAELKAKFALQGIELSKKSPREFEKLVNSEVLRWKAIVQHSGATVD